MKRFDPSGHRSSLPTHPGLWLVPTGSSGLNWCDWSRSNYPKVKGSDLHMKVGRPPMIRTEGDVRQSNRPGTNRVGSGIRGCIKPGHAADGSEGNRRRRSGDLVTNRLLPKSCENE
jgi:hypothetical protein